jgi:sugar phosphate isomerase/epimerase
MVELAVTPDRRWTATTAELLAATTAAGFSALGAFADQAGPDVRQLYDDAQVRCHEMLALVVSDDEGETIRSAQALVDAAGVMGAEWVLTVFSCPLTGETAPIVQRSAAVIAEVGAAMAVEFSPLGPISSVRSALGVVGVANAGGGRAGLLIDTWHFERGESTWDDLEAVPLDQIAYVQFSDALAPAGDSLARETMHRRAVPGDGTLALDRFATTLLRRGWDGLVSVEVLSAELRALPVDEALRRLHDTTAPYWL